MLFNKAAKEVLEQLRKRTPLPYTQYKVITDSISRPVIDGLLSGSTLRGDYDEISRLLYRLHNVLFRFDLTSGRPFAIGTTSSLNINASCLASYLYVELAAVCEDHLVDQSYYLSLTQTESRHYLSELLARPNLLVFREGEITGGEAYYLLIALGVGAGGVFEDYVYRACFKQLLYSLQSRYFATWSSTQSLQLVELSAYLLVDRNRQLDYYRNLRQLFKEVECENGLDAVSLCYNTFTQLKEEN